MLYSVLRVAATVLFATLTTLTAVWTRNLAATGLADGKVVGTYRYFELRSTRMFRLTHDAYFQLERHENQ